MPPTLANSMATRATLRKLNVDKALLTELEPLMSAPIQKYKGGGTFIQGARKIRLMGADSRATSARMVYYEQILGIRAPTLYDYNQKLVVDKFVTARDGTKVQVRRRGTDGEWIVSKKGEDYFRYRQIEFIPRAPRIVVKMADGYGEELYLFAMPAKAGDYIGVPGLEQITASRMRQA